MTRALEEILSNYDKLLLVRVSEFPEFFNKLKEFETLTFQQISESEFQALLELYSTYEFSDKFLPVFNNDINYANLHNMVDMGILSLEELFAALLS